VIAHSQYQKSKRISIFLSMQDEIETKEIIKDIFRQGKTCFIPRYQFQSSHMDMVRLASPEEISSLPRTSWNIPQPGEDEVREEALSTGINVYFTYIPRHSPGLGLPMANSEEAASGPVPLTSLLDCLQRALVFRSSTRWERQKLLPRGSFTFGERKHPAQCHERVKSPGGLDLIFMPGLGFDNHGNRLGRGKGYYDTYLKRCLQSQDGKPYTLALAFREQICPQVPVDENDVKVDEVLYEDSSAP
ncbi:hypothetical protein CB1_001254021, partial [Camelus ferus]